MREHHAEIASRMADERLRQERETFNQHKAHQNRWFRLRLAMGWAAAFLLPSILLVSGYILVNHASFPTAVVTTAGGALLVDALGIVSSVWKIVLDREFMTQLAPVTNVQSSNVSGEDTEDEYKEGADTEGEDTQDDNEDLTILSATYGAGDARKDVTELLRSRISGGSLGIRVSNDVLDCDPAPGVVKTLEATYSHGGKTYSRTILESLMLYLP